MRILVPVDRPWEIVGGGPDDVSVASDGVVLRTLLRTGTRMVRDAVLSTPTDRRAVAALAARSLLLETTVFAGSRAENRAAMEAVSLQADLLAATGGDWEPLDVDGTTFALWTTRFDAGVAAAADLGPCVLAAWSADASARLPALTLVDAPE
ncbi:hypothetical protein ASF48_01980 [Rathayibacter sp. Leaf299]|uniref:hypothetical protein n=1 Tax=Rathayibacter sp. Leaf299 TaxID=1736328 RepID=UPI0006F44942|nr:hypothetical protein [Rathayibacter sp. Leaf299]KQQ22024.1 hypothetical protein ASF48_01980 [Rathayibacter sp. Leaf299]